MIEVNIYGVECCEICGYISANYIDECPICEETTLLEETGDLEDYLECVCDVCKQKFEFVNKQKYGYVKLKTIS